MNFTILRLDSVDSTNTEALRQARQGADEGLCVVAVRQTAGRGRHGRTWVSPPDSGLYFSIVLRPKFDVKLVPLITLMTGIAVYDTLADLGLKPDIKWVNDLLVEEKKVCGILAETAETARGLTVVAGIGVNARSTSFPPELADSATSVSSELGRDVAPAEIEQPLVRFLGYWYEVLGGEGGPGEIRDGWRRRSSYFSGKPVRVRTESGTLTGVTDGLAANGALRLRKDDGQVVVLQAGDVQRLRHSGAGE